MSSLLQTGFPLTSNERLVADYIKENPGSRVADIFYGTKDRMVPCSNGMVTMCMVESICSRLIYGVIRKCQKAIDLENDSTFVEVRYYLA